MKKLLLLLLALPAVTYLFAQTGSVTGMVYNPGKEALPGAYVLLSGTNAGAISELDGGFSLFNVPVGKQQLIISYLGYGNDTLTIHITAGQTLKLGAIVLQEAGHSLSEVEIKAGLKKGSESKAINITKSSSRVITVISSENISKLPDKNAAETVKRIAGAAVQNNKGEGAYISLRGTPLDWTATLMNGDRIPVADEENTSRIFEFEVLPSDLIDYVIVSRTVTPDIEGDNIGGSINFLTKSAVEERTFKVNMALGASVLARKPTGNLNFLWGDVSKNKKFSYVINGSYFGRFYASQGYKLAFGSNYNHGLNRFELKDYDGTRQSFGGNFACEYKLSDKIKLGMKAISGGMLDDKWQRKTMYVYDSGDGKGMKLQSIHGKLNRVMAGGELNAEITPISKLKLNLRLASYHNQFTYGNVPYAKGDPRNGYFTEEFGIRSVFVYQDIDTIDLFGNAYTGAPGQIPFPTKLLGQDNPYGRGDDYKNIKPRLTTPVVADSFEFKRAFSELNTTKETDPIVAQADFTYSFNNNIKLLGGAKFRWKMGERNLSFHEWLLNIYDQQSAAPIYMMSLQTQPFDERGGYLKEYGSPYKGSFMPFITKDQNRAFLEQYAYRLRERNMNELHPEYAQWVGSSYKYREYTTAGYLMGDFRIGRKFNIVTGLRLENTNMHVESDTLSSKYAIDTASGTVYYPGERRYSDIKYLAILPAFNFTYAITNNMNLRAAVSRTYHRQNFAEVKPGYAVIKYSEFEFVFGNPNLKPAYSYNFDLMYEYFWGNKGLFTVGTYFKYITDHIFVTTQADFDPRTGIVYKAPTNAGKSWVFGVEANIQRKMDFLPGGWGGIGVSANITYSLSRMQVPGRDNSQAMAEQTPLLYNVALYYEKYGLETRLALNYTGAYLKELNLASVKGLGLLHKDSDYDIFQGENYSLDFQCAYTFKKHYTVYVEMNNLLDWPYLEFMGNKNRPIRVEYYRQRGQVGFKYEL
ncbi:MAG: TonB-dependent receptor [Chitinophagales bacterium]